MKLELQQDDTVTITLPFAGGEFTIDYGSNTLTIHTSFGVPTIFTWIANEYVREAVHMVEDYSRSTH